MLGKRYNVVAEDGMDYILEDGRAVPFYETDEIEFVIAEVEQIEPVEHEKLLDDLSQLLEFGNMEYIYERLTDNTVYISYAENLTLSGRENIYDYIEKLSKERVEQNIFSDVVISTVNKDDDKGHKQGERFLMVFHNNGTISSAFLYDDGSFITKIELFDSYLEYQCDVRGVNALGNTES